MFLDQSLKALHDDRSQCYRAIVTQFSFLCFLGYRNNGGHHEECGDSRLGQGDIDYVRKHSSQLVYAWTRLGIPGTTRGLTSVNVLLTSAMEKPTVFGSRPCQWHCVILNPDEEGAQHVRKQDIVSATWLVFPLQSVIVCRPCHIRLVSELLNCYSILSLY